MTKCAIQGIAGSYSEQAAKEMLGAEAEIISYRDFAAASRAAAVGDVDVAVLPIENKIIGEITENAIRVAIGAFVVHRRLRLPIDHVLAVKPGTLLSDVRKVVSHPAALLQCKRFLRAKPGLLTSVSEDTASAIRDLMYNGDIRTAAIGSRRAAEMYGASIIADDISDEADNWTTFILIERAPTKR